MYVQVIPLILEDRVLPSDVIRRQLCTGATTSQSQ